MKNEEYIKTKKLIRKCFNINYSIPKGYGTRSDDYEKWYNMKTEIINKIIDNIKKYHLPIKYGINDENYSYYDRIIYFEFENEQFSFHRPPKCKKFNGEWTGIRRDSYERNSYGGIIGLKSLF